MRIKDLVIGDYDEEHIKEERETLINNYSPQEHVKALLFDYIEKNLDLSYYSDIKLEKRLKMFERITNYWVFWRIKRSMLFGKFFDDFDRHHYRSSIKEGDLEEANSMLRKYTQSINELEELDTFDGIPQIDIF